MICGFGVYYSIISRINMCNFCFAWSASEHFLIHKQLNWILSSLMASTPKITEIYRKPGKTLIKKCYSVLILTDPLRYNQYYIFTWYPRTMSEGMSGICVQLCASLMTGYLRYFQISRAECFTFLHPLVSSFYMHTVRKVHSVILFSLAVIISGWTVFMYARAVCDAFYIEW